MISSRDHGLTINLLGILGLYVDDDFTIKEDIYDTSIRFSGKNLKLPPPNTDPNVYLNWQDDVLCNPIKNVSLMKHLFEFYIDVIRRERGIYITSYYDDSKNKHFCVVCKCIYHEDPEIQIPYDAIGSQWYSNIVLAYYDMILILGGCFPINLHPLDTQLTLELETD